MPSNPIRAANNSQMLLVGAGIIRSLREKKKLTLLPQPAVVLTTWCCFYFARSWVPVLCGFCTTDTVPTASMLGQRRSSGLLSDGTKDDNPLWSPYQLLTCSDDSKHTALHSVTLSLQSFHEMLQFSCGRIFAVYYLSNVIIIVLRLHTGFLTFMSQSAYKIAFLHVFMELITAEMIAAVCVSYTAGLTIIWSWSKRGSCSVE